MKLEIRKAVPEEYDLVQAFYDEVIDRLDEYEYGPMWKKGIYPAYDDLRRHIQEENLYIGLSDDRILAAMVLNTVGNESYANAHWLADLAEGEYMVIHMLGIMPDCVKQGLGRQMVEFAIRKATGTYRSVRLDVLKGNKAANYLYESVGFVQTDMIRMYYEDTDWMEFELYEYLL